MSTRKTTDKAANPDLTAAVDITPAEQAVAPPPPPDPTVKLPQAQWITVASTKFNVPTEVLRSALIDSPDELSADEIESAISEFLNRPVGS